MKGPSCWLEVICLALMMFNWRWSTTFAQGCSPEHQSKTFVFELGVICGLLAGALTTCLIHMHSAIVCNVIHCSGISWCRGVPLVRRDVLKHAWNRKQKDSGNDRLATLAASWLGQPLM